MNHCMKCRASISLAVTACPQCGWEFKILANDPFAEAKLTVDGRWALTTTVAMRRFCYIQAVLFVMSFNLIFLYYFWIAAEYGRDPPRAAWHLILLSWITAGCCLLTTLTLMYYSSHGSSLSLRLLSARLNNVWPIVMLVLGLAMTAVYALPIISRCRYRAQYLMR